jgi:hypothetical protein
MRFGPSAVQVRSSGRGKPRPPGVRSPGWRSSRDGARQQNSSRKSVTVCAPSQAKLPFTLSHLKQVPIRILEPRSGTPGELEDLGWLEPHSARFQRLERRPDVFHLDRIDRGTCLAPCAPLCHRQPKLPPTGMSRPHPHPDPSSCAAPVRAAIGQGQNDHPRQRHRARPTPTRPTGPLHIGGKWEDPANGISKPKALPPIATSCRSERMVSRRSLDQGQWLHS